MPQNRIQVTTTGFNVLNQHIIKIEEHYQLLFITSHDLSQEFNHKMADAWKKSKKTYAH